MKLFTATTTIITTTTTHDIEEVRATSSAHPGSPPSIHSLIIIDININHIRIRQRRSRLNRLNGLTPTLRARASGDEANRSSCLPFQRHHGISLAVIFGVVVVVVAVCSIHVVGLVGFAGVGASDGLRCYVVDVRAGYG
jgi:hypothetical protein